MEKKLNEINSPKMVKSINQATVDKRHVKSLEREAKVLKRNNQYQA